MNLCNFIEMIEENNTASKEQNKKFRTSNSNKGQSIIQQVRAINAIIRIFQL